MSVVTSEPAVFRSASAILAESPWWDGDALYWCDITTGQLHVSPIDGPSDGSRDRVLRLPPPLASFQPRTAGAGFVAALGDRIVLVDNEGNLESVLASVEHAHAGIRFNEGKCDPYGRFVAGSMNLTSGLPDAAFYSFEADGTVRVLLAGVGTANGLEWSLDLSTVYLTDTSVQTIYQAPYSEAGELGELSVFHAGAMHDGLAIDSEGFLWGAIYGGGRVVRYSPDGEEDLIVEVPAPNVTGIAFGGRDLSTLYIATARENLDESSLEKFPLSGSIFAVETGVRGRPVRRFGANAP